MAVFLMHDRESGIEKLLAKLKFPSGFETPNRPQPTYLIRWGNKVEGPASIPTLNKLSAVIAAQDLTKREETLQRHGLKPGKLPLSAKPDTSEWTYTALYWIPVFHMEALAVYEKSLVEPLLLPSRLDRNSGYRELARPRNGYHVLRATKTAIRAVYALGLDFALVQIGIDPVRGTMVLDVKPNPKLTDKLSTLFAAAMNRFAAEEGRSHTIGPPLLLGADPEFILRNPYGKIIPASRFMDRTGQVGCDAVVLRGRRLIHPLVEIRPEPAAHPLELLGNLRAGLLQAKEQIADDTLEWLAGGMPVKGIPLGGHIHFSGIWMHADFIRKLDNYVALPIALLEDEQSHMRRPLYGYLGDCRRKPHGGFEYRTLPSWLLSPAIASGVLSLAFLIAEQHRFLQQEPLADAEVQEAFYNPWSSTSSTARACIRPWSSTSSTARQCVRGNRKELIRVADLLWEELEALPGYAAYRNNLLPLKEVLFSGCPPDSGRDIRPAWEL